MMMLLLRKSADECSFLCFQICLKLLELAGWLAVADIAITPEQPQLAHPGTEADARIRRRRLESGECSEIPQYRSGAKSTSVMFSFASLASLRFCKRYLSWSLVTAKFWWCCLLKVEFVMKL
jgi:hypothetical protein